MIDINKLPSANDNLSKILFNCDCKTLYLYDIYYEISESIFDYRIKQGWSIKQLAKYLNITPKMASKFESGEYNFTIKQIIDICDKLGYMLKINIEKNHVCTTDKNKYIELFIQKIKEKYPDLHIQYDIDPEDGLYDIWHTNDYLQFQDKKFAGFIGELITHIFYENDIFNFSFGYDYDKTKELEEKLLNVT